MSTFGDKLREARKAKNLTQESLADDIETTQQYISEWERNKSEPTLSFILKLLKALDISFDELLDGVEPRK